MSTAAYFKRIAIEKIPPAADLQTLYLLQKQHLVQVPFENLDIHWKRPILLDVNKFYQKIVEQKRGGFCYELNGLFQQLLSEIGFRSKIISARVSIGNGEFSPEYDHLAIVSEIDGEEFLVDVGFGDFTAEPLKFVLNEEQSDPNGIFLIRKFDDEYFEVVKKDGENWRGEYIFKNLEHDLSEFAEMCNFHQTSPDSHFTRGKVCSLMLVNGRQTLTDKKFIKTRNGVKVETEITSENEFDEVLEREFGIKKSFS